MSELPADGAFPVRYFTGIGYAWSAGQQKLWQADADYFEAKLIKSMQARIDRRKPEPKPPQFVLDFMQRNPFKLWLS